MPERHPTGPTTTTRDKHGYMQVCCQVIQAHAARGSLSALLLLASFLEVESLRELSGHGRALRGHVLQVYISWRCSCCSRKMAWPWLGTTILVALLLATSFYEMFGCSDPFRYIPILAG